MDVTCDNCGTVFHKPKCHIKRVSKNYCIRKCADEGRSSYFLGSNNPNWKGEAVGYVSLHYYIKARLPKPRFCQHCGLMRKLDLANKTGNYSRDLSDWLWLCRSCHNLYDRRSKREWKFKKVGTNVVRKAPKTTR